MTRHIYVDETKHHDYLLVAVDIPSAHLVSMRKLIQSLVLSGQRRIHMKAENDSRKRAIATAIASSGIQATIYNAGRRYRTERDRRAACLQALLAQAANYPDVVLILEQDDTLLSWDNQQLIELTRKLNCRDTVRYCHHRASAEPLLAVSDVIAWCWAKGGDWHRRITPAVNMIYEV